MGGLIPSILTGLGQGYVQGEKDRMARERQQQEDEAQERTRALLIYKAVAERDPELANMAMSRDPRFANDIRPILEAQRQANESRRNQIMADPDPGGVGSAAAAAVTQPRLTLPTPANAYGPGYGPQAESFINSSPLYRQQRIDALGKAQGEARQKAVDEKRAGLLADLPDPDVAAVFRRQPDYVVGKAGDVVWDRSSNQVVHFPMSPEVTEQKAAESKAKAEQKAAEAKAAAERKRQEDERKHQLRIAEIRERAQGSLEVARVSAAAAAQRAREAREANAGSKRITQQEYSSTKIRLTNDIARLAQSIKESQDPILSYAPETARQSELAELRKAQDALRRELVNWETAWQQQQAAGGASTKTSTPGKPQPKTTPAPAQGGLITNDSIKALIEEYKRTNKK